MAKYNLEVKPSVWKDLDPVPKADRKRLIKRINELRIEPRPFGCQKLSGHERYRIRQGNYRILYTIEDELLIVFVIKIGNRREIYKR